MKSAGKGKKNKKKIEYIFNYLVLSGNGLFEKNDTDDYSLFKNT